MGGVRRRAAGRRRAAAVAAGRQRLRHRLLRRRRAQHAAGRLAVLLQRLRSRGLHLARQAADRLLDPDRLRRRPGLQRLVDPSAAGAGRHRLGGAALSAGAAVRRARRHRRGPAAGDHAHRRRGRPLEQHRFLADLLPAAGREDRAARPRPVAGGGDGAAGPRLQRQDAGGAGLRAGPAGGLAAGRIARLAPAAGLDGGGRRHARGRVAFLGGRLRPHAQGEPALCRQQPRQFHARADRHAQRARALRAQHAGACAVAGPDARASSPTMPCRSAPLRLADPALAMQFAWMLPLAVLGAVFAWRRRRAQVALWSVWALTYGIVYSAGRRHLPRLLPVDPGAAARGAGRHRLLRTVAPRLDASRRRPRRRCAVAGLHRRRVAGLDVDLGRLPRRGAAGRQSPLSGAASVRRPSSAASPCWCCRRCGR